MSDDKQPETYIAKPWPLVQQVATWLCQHRRITRDMPSEKEILDARTPAIALIDLIIKGMGKDEEFADNQAADGTPLAHPAWWRGEEQAVGQLCQLIHEILDGKDNGSGANREPWGKCRRRLLEAAVYLRNIEHACKGSIITVIHPTDDLGGQCTMMPASFMHNGVYITPRHLIDNYAKEIRELKAEHEAHVKDLEAKVKGLAEDLDRMNTRCQLKEEEMTGVEGEAKVKVKVEQWKHAFEVQARELREMRSDRDKLQFALLQASSPQGMTPRYLSKEELLANLAGISAAIDNDDSFEGSINYSCLSDGGRQDAFAVRMVYRIGNMEGAGVLRIIGEIGP